MSVPTHVPLDKLSPSFNKSSPNQQFQGKVISVFPYNTQTKLNRFVLSSLIPSASPDIPAAKVQVEFKGLWAKDIVFRPGESVMLTADFAETKLAKIGTKDFKICYEGGVRGALGQVGHPPSPFSYIASKSKSMSNPPIRPKVPVVTKPVVLQATKVGKTFAEAEAAQQHSPSPILPKRSRTISEEAESLESKNTGDSNSSKENISVINPAVKKVKVAKNVVPQYWPKHMSSEVHGLNFVGLDQLEARKSEKGIVPTDIIVICYNTKPQVRNAYGWTWILTIIDRDTETTPLSLELVVTNVNEFPVFEDGDVILFRNLKYVNAYGGSRLQGQKGTFRFKTFSKRELLDPTILHLENPCLTVKAGDQIYYKHAEVKYARSLAGWGSNLVAKPLPVVAQAPAVQIRSRPGGRELMEVQHMPTSGFCNLVCEVIHIQDYMSGNGSARVELKVTDYTENENLYEMSDESGSFEGPYGKKVIEVTLWGVRTTGFEAWKRGTLLYLDNVGLKMSSAGYLEARVGDSKNGEVEVLLNNKGRVSKGKQGPEIPPRMRNFYDGLMKRRKLYWEEFAASKNYDADADGMTAKSEEIDQLPSTPISANQGVKTGVSEREYTSFAEMKEATRRGVDGYYRLRVVFGGFGPTQRDARTCIKAICPDCIADTKGNTKKAQLAQSLTQCDIHSKVELQYFFALRFNDPTTRENIIVLVDVLDSDVVLPNLPPTADMRDDGPELNLFRNRFKKVNEGKPFDICVRAYPELTTKIPFYRLHQTSFIG